MIKWLAVIALVVVIGVGAFVYLAGNDAGTVAEVGCEDLVKQHLKDPNALTFDHDQTSNDGDRWTIHGTATWDGGSGDYQCTMTVNGSDWRGRVVMGTS